MIRAMTWEDIRQMIIAHQGWDPGTEEEAKASICKPISQEEIDKHPFLQVLDVRKDFGRDD